MKLSLSFGVARMREFIERGQVGAHDLGGRALVLPPARHRGSLHRGPDTLDAFLSREYPVTNDRPREHELNLMNEREEAG